MARVLPISSLFKESNDMAQTLIDYYKAIEDGSARMLDAAKVQDWDAVVRFESACAVLIEQLRALGKSHPLDEATRAEKSRIMLRILGNDAQIRYLAEPWLDQCEARFEQRGLLH
jgi:flagellar protein FliT